MGEFGDRLATMVLRATSPDGHIHGEVRGTQVEITFATEAYRSYREPALARQLGQLGALLWTRHRRAYLENLEDYLGALVDDGFESPEEREFWQRLEQLTVTGVSPAAVVAVRSRALVSWDVEIAPGTLRALRENEFLRELHGAVQATVDDYRARVTLLMDELRDFGLPASVRDGGGAARRVP